MDGNDAWGISGSDFLRWYLIAAVLAVVLTLLGKWIADKRSVSSASAVRALTPPEIGALTSDGQAVLASLAILREVDVIDARGRTLRTLTDTERTELDWFTRIVLARLGSGIAPLVRARLFARMAGPCAQLRTALADEGLLEGRPKPSVSTIRVLPVLIVVAVGSVRVISGFQGGKPGLLLVAVIVLLLLTLPFVPRRRRRTALGEAELRRLRADNDYLSPRPGISVALFGTNALLVLDPAMVTALSHGSPPPDQAPLAGMSSIGMDSYSRGFGV